VTGQGSPGTVEETGAEVEGADVVAGGLAKYSVVVEATVSNEAMVVVEATVVVDGGIVVANAVVFGGGFGTLLVDGVPKGADVLVAWGAASWRVGVAGSLQAAPRTNRAATKTRRGSAVISL